MSREDLERKKDRQNKINNSTEMAVERTLMAADRSLMAWVRTGLSLISFGFTIYKFLDYSRQQLETVGKELSGISSPKLVGLMLIGLGILSLVFGTMENLSTTKSLRGQYSVRRKRYALFMAVMVTLFGLIVFLGIVLHVKGIGTS